MPTTVYDKSATLAGTDDSGGDANINFRQVVKASLLGAATGNQVRVSLLFGNVASSVTGAITSIYIGQAAASGHEYDFNGNQVQLLFGGSGSVNCSNAGAPTSDWVTLGEAYDNTKNYIVSWHVLSSATGYTHAFGTVTNADLFFDGGGTDSAATSVLTLGSSALDTDVLLTKIEIQAAGGAPTIVEQNFFDIVRLKRATAYEFSQGPFAGTSPPLTGPFATSSFFEQVKLKQPIINISDITPVEPIRLAGERWFDQVQLKRPTIDNPPILFTPPVVTVTANIVEQPFFEPVRLLRPSEFSQGPFFISAVSFSASNWFDQVRLLKIPERLQEAFGVPFAPGQSLQAWFEALQKLKVPGDFPFTATGAVQLVTIQNALTDWFPQLRLKQPIIDPGLVVFFPAQIAPSAPAEVHNLMFFADVGSLMGR